MSDSGENYGYAGFLMDACDNKVREGFPDVFSCPGSLGKVLRHFYHEYHMKGATLIEISGANNESWPRPTIILKFDVEDEDKKPRRGELYWTWETFDPSKTVPSFKDQPDSGTVKKIGDRWVWGDWSEGLKPYIGE